MHCEFDPHDYAVVVKLRATPPKPWRWEIYCAGKRLPIERSPSFYESRQTAQIAGKHALTRLIEKLSA
jgi:hypothetical protein